MAFVVTVSNHAAYQIAMGNIDLPNDAFKIILMNSGFVFDRDTHATLADVTSSQLATGNGYTQDDKILTGITIAEDDVIDGATIVWDSAIWTAAGGAIGPAGSAIVIDDSTADDTVLMCIDFGGDLSAADGIALSVEEIEFRAVTTS